MNIALFGATGGTGRAIIEQALAAGHSIHALVRDPLKLENADGVTVTQGDARDAAAVRTVLAGADVAISTLGNFNRKPNTDVSDATKTLVAAMVEVGPKRLVVVSTIGVGDSLKQLKSFVFKHIIIGMVAKNIWKDRERQEAVITASGLDWTIARPGGLKDGPKTGAYHVIGGGDPQPKKIMINRADVADYCLKAAGDDAAIGKTVCLFS
ncbi:MAG: NAD(P)-binding oxidoreductase [Pseudomonadota bacterium]